jgi:hypothetical protein
VAEQDQIPDELIITLRRPAKLGEISYDTIRLREPTAGELMALDAETGWTKTIHKIAKVSGLPQPAIDQICLRDITEASAYLKRFSVSSGETEDNPDELVITLRAPVTLGTETYSQLCLREPNAGEMIKLDKVSGWTANVKAISLISGVPELAVIKIGERDAQRAAEYLGRFFGDDLSIGADG